MSIAILLSGGVDSSVALRRLQEAGHRDMTAFYLKIWLEDELAFLGECPWEEDLDYARKVCDQADVPLEIVSLQTEYYQRVVSYAIAELEAGRTPSPDIFCNQRIKFGAFLDRIDSRFERIASGHYARISKSEGLYYLSRGVDPVKDQSYFLSHLHQEQLARCIFPIGELPKSEVRKQAARFNLPNKDRRDSQGICFLGKIPFTEFVKSQLGEKPGEIREHGSERVLGEHHGYWFHTIGQRRGLRLSQGPWFVVDKDIERNIVYVSHRDQFPGHGRRHYRVDAPHWITRPPLGDKLQVKLRHTPRLHDCRITERGDGTLDVELDETDQGIAPGQFTVFYEDEICLGGARIRTTDSDT